VDAALDLLDGSVTGIATHSTESSARAAAPIAQFLLSEPLPAQDQVIMTSLPPSAGSRRSFRWATVIGLSGVAAVGVARLAQWLDAERHTRHQRDLDDQPPTPVCSDPGDAALEAVKAQLIAIAQGDQSPPWPSLHTGAERDDLLADVRQLIGEVQDRGDATRAAMVALARQGQTSAHQVQEMAAAVVSAVPDNADVLDWSMRIGHTAAQQARRAQSLTVLCGEWPGQQWPEPVSLENVARAAAGRIEEFQRVKIGVCPSVRVDSLYVEPLIHLLAELLDNAARSSAPRTPVLVEMTEVFRGWAIEIIDDGLGFASDGLAAAQQRVSGPHHVSLSDLGVPPQTGLAVVGIIARRHGFRVELGESVYGGVRAVVVVPNTLLIPAGTGDIAPQPRRTLVPPVGGQPQLTRGPSPAASATPRTVEGAELPQRRNHRGTVPPPSQHRGTAAVTEPAQTPAEAGQFLAGLLRPGESDTDGNGAGRTSGSIKDTGISGEQG
jgi:hypothetical protein